MVTPTSQRDERGITSAYVSAGIRKWWLKSVFGLAALAAVLFLLDGGWNWWEAWAYLGLSIGGTLLISLTVARANPELLAIRGHGGIKPGTKSWDRVLIPLIAFSASVGIWIISGLDFRFGWSPPVPIAVWVAAGALWIAAMLWVDWALVVNKFFEASVRIQEDRGHTVVTTGPYRYMRHPGYAAAIVMSLAAPLLLGSWLALMSGGLAAGLFILRTALEDRTLRAELAGYQEYARRVRYRLLPGIW
ncbi:MAG: methyltransferase family protein [Dehalococcoidia bacterium]